VVFRKDIAKQELHFISSFFPPYSLLFSLFTSSSYYSTLILLFLLIFSIPLFIPVPILPSHSPLILSLCFLYPFALCSFFLSLIYINSSSSSSSSSVAFGTFLLQKQTLRNLQCREDLHGIRTRVCHDAIRNEIII